MALGDTRILILGGGFAGVYAALHLERILARRQGFEITLVSSENFLLFTPMLPEVPSSSIEPRHFISPLRAFFRKVKFQNYEVRFLDLEKRVVGVSHCPMCSQHELRFDHLVLALGSMSNFHFSFAEKLELDAFTSRRMSTVPFAVTSNEERRRIEPVASTGMS